MQQIQMRGKIFRIISKSIKEIFFIVIGIIIAFQLEDVNNRRLQRIREKEILAEIKRNLLNDLNEIELNRKLLLKIQKSNFMIINYLGGKQNNITSISASLNNVGSGVFFITEKMGYDELQSEGIGIVSNRVLGKEIINIYEAKYDYLRKVENEIDLNFRMSILLPILNKCRKHLSSEGFCHFNENMSLEAKNELIESLLFDKKNKNTQLKIYSELSSKIIYICSILRNEL